MAALKKYSLLIISYLLILAVAGVVGIYSVGQSMASSPVIVGSDTGLSISPVDASVFNIDNMYPGKTETSEITIRNDGSDPFTLVIDITPSGDGALIDVLSVKVSDSGNVYYNGSMASADSIDLGEIAANANLLLNIAVTMSADAGNETQNKSFETLWAFNAVSLGSQDPGDEEGGETVTPISPTTEDSPFVPFTDALADLAAADDAADGTVPEGIVTAVAAELPTGQPEQALQINPDDVQVAPEDPQAEPIADRTTLFAKYWPLLLLALLPLLIWMFAGMSVLILVPEVNGKYKTVALKLAGRRNKHWFVNIEKDLEKHLEKYGKVAVDFRGPMVRDARTSVYIGDKLLSSSDMRYAVIGERRLASWTDNLNQQANRMVG